MREANLYRGKDHRGKDHRGKDHRGAQVQWEFK